MADQDTQQPTPANASADHDPAFAVIVAAIERLDDLDLATVEPASAFHWD